MWISDFWWRFQFDEGEGVDVLGCCCCGSVGILFLAEFFWEWFFFGVIVVKTRSSTFSCTGSSDFWSFECGEAEGVEVLVCCFVAVLVLYFVQN